MDQDRQDEQGTAVSASESVTMRPPTKEEMMAGARAIEEKTVRYTQYGWEFTIRKLRDANAIFTINDRGRLLASAAYKSADGGKRKITEALAYAAANLEACIVSPQFTGKEWVELSELHGPLVLDLSNRVNAFNSLEGQLGEVSKD